MPYKTRTSVEFPIVHLSARALIGVTLGLWLGLGLNLGLGVGPGLWGVKPAIGQPNAASAEAAVVKPACGVTAIPLLVGNEWLYEPTAPPPDRALPDAAKRLTPVEPKKLAIKVTSIETTGGVTTVSLSESLDGRVHSTWIKCAGGGATFQIAPDAFWFAGEPGATFGIELSSVERKGQTLGLAAGKLTALEWRDDMTATWKHVPTGKVQPNMREGKLEVRRHWVVQPDEEISTPASGIVMAKKIGVEITIKVSIEPPPVAPIKDPPLMVNFLWYVNGIGPVQVLNSYGQMFQLTSAITK
jgi:hypothetical protein